MHFFTVNQESSIIPYIVQLRSICIAIYNNVFYSVSNNNEIAIGKQLQECILFSHIKDLLVYCERRFVED